MNIAQRPAQGNPTTPAGALACALLVVGRQDRVSDKRHGHHGSGGKSRQMLSAPPLDAFFGGDWAWSSGW